MNGSLYCSECGVGFAPGTARCLVCGGRLVEESPDGSRDNALSSATPLADLTTVPLPWARELSDELLAVGIPHRIEAELEPSGPEPPCLVQVPEDRLADAEHVRLAVRRRQIPPTLEEPLAGSAFDAARRSGRHAPFRLIAGLLLGGLALWVGSLLLAR